MMKGVEDLVGYPRTKLDLTSNAGVNPRVLAAPGTELKGLANIVNLLDSDSEESDGDLETSDDQYGGEEAVETSRAHG